MARAAEEHLKRLAALVLLAASGCGPNNPAVYVPVHELVATAIQSGAVASPLRTTPTRATDAPAVLPDGSSVESIVIALYQSVSHGPEYEPAWNRLRALFLPEAIILPPKRADAEAFTVLDVNGFEDRIRRYIAGRREKGEQLGFTEREIARRENRFGDVCQVFSTYETVRAPNDPAPFARGIHSIQLVNDGHRWWIAALAWDTERPDNPIMP